MDELGTILREAREAKGLTIKQVYEEIRISTRFLEALEEGQYDRLPSPTHIRGYLRNYARFLNLAPDPLLERYENSVKAPPPPKPVSSKDLAPVLGKPLKVRDDQPFFDPVNVGLSPATQEGEAGAGLRWAIIAAFVFMLALIAYRVYPLVVGDNDPLSPFRDAVAQIGTEDEPLVNEELSDGALTVAGEPATDTSRNTGADVSVPSTVVDVVIPTPQATRPALPAVIDEIDLRVDVIERTWLRITVDGEIQYQGLARANDVFEFTAIERVEVAAGNAVGAVVTINDVELGRLGARGENITEEWQVTNGG